MSQKAQKSISKLGLASFICGLLFPLTLAVSYQFPYRGWSFDVTLIGSVVTAVGATGLGIGTLFQKRTHRAFGVIGLVIGVLEVTGLLIVAVIVWGFVALFGRR